MKAIVIAADKSLHWQDQPEPIPGPHQIAIKVHASAVNRADLMQRLGVYPPPPGASDILGLECAGEVSAIGAQVSQWQIGDRVCALLAGGGYAETVVCHAEHALPIPAGFSFSQAAALPEVFATAWLNLFMLAQVQPGQKVALHAGASGVGTAAIQLCKAKGNPVFVTVGDQAKLDYCQQLGAAAGHIRSQGEFEPALKSWSGKAGVAAILDPVGGNYLEQNLKCLDTDGSLIIIGLMGGRSANLDIGRLLVKRIRVVGSTLRSRSDASKAEIISQLASQVWPLFESGELAPIIYGHFPIIQATDAFELVASNQTIGKVILEMTR
jgi:putative PIG3 family NAD(P)H quinone oxidoreductase